MDLKNQSITLRELMAEPRSKAVLQRRFGPLLRHPMAGMAMCLTLGQLCEMSRGKLPPQLVQDTLRELEQL